MKPRYAQYSMALAVAAALAGCGSSSNPGAPSAPAAGNAMLLSVPGISSAVSYSFDLGAYDPATGNYYVTDRTNKSIDWIHIGGGWGAVATNPVVHQFKNSSFAGCNSGGTSGGAAGTPYIPMPGCLNIAITPNQTYVVNNDLSGPDGLDVVGANLFVGDTNALWVMNKNTGATVTKVSIPNSGTQQGFRSDEGCHDPVNHLYATALTGDPNNPFYTILDTTAHDADATGATPPVLIGYVLMNDSTGAPSAGLEACAFDTRGYAAGTGFMWLNNDGSTANPNGETDGIPIADLLAMKTTPIGGNKRAVFAGSAAGPFADQNAATSSAAQCTLGGGGACGGTAVKVMALPALCDPTGLALGPANDVGAMCRPGTFNQRMDFVIWGNTQGAQTQTIVPGAGGGDQVWFDAGSNRYYLSDSRMTSTGKSCFKGGVQVCNLTPKLVAVDGTTKAEVGRFDQGNNGHSVAVGGGLVLLPFTNSSAAGGGAAFPGGGIAVFPAF